MRKIIVVVIGIICLYSCNRQNTQVETALKLADDNKKELKAVIRHYSKNEDSLKLKAAYFLIGNMTHQYSNTSGKFDSYDEVFNEIEKYERTHPVKGNYVFPHVDSIWDGIVERLNRYSNFSRYTSDLHQMTSELLIENIDYAFKAWEMPWSKHLNFQEFCEYILPYRSTDEKLESWRPIYFQKFQWVLDSIKDKTDPVEACTLINKNLKKWFRYSDAFKEYNRAISPTNLLVGKKGVCRDQNSLAIFSMRAMGIPVVHEYVPHWADRSMGHDFTAVLNKNGKFIDFLGSEHHPGENDIFNIPPKIFRQTFEVQKNMVTLDAEKNKLPHEFRSYNFIDVTADYYPVSSLKFKLSNPSKEAKMAFLTVFDNKSWNAVGWSDIKEGGLVKFERMGRRAVYLPQYFIDSRYQIAHSPIRLDSLGKTITLRANTNETQNVRLLRKYPLTKWKRQWKTHLVNGKFQGSNKADFSDAKDLYTIKKPTELREYKKAVINPGSYQYVRYLFPDNVFGSLAEIGFYNNNKAIKGLQIRAEGVSKKDMTIAFDGKFIPYIGTDEEDEYNGLWVGLNFGSSKFIDHVSFCPRTDENNIYLGLTYELFYWDNGWVSLGQKIADSNELNYKDVPTNALFLLRNLMKGIEERIFTYENGEQIWW